jgi:plastocyanin
MRALEANLLTERSDVPYPRTAITIGIVVGAVLIWPGTNDPTRASVPPVGVIEGRVTYEGATPSPTIVIEGGSTQQVVYVDKTGGLRYVAAYLPDSRNDGTRVARTTAAMNQRSFIFEPQVLAVRAGESVQFTNEDPANHNVRSDATDATNRFSVYTGAGEVSAHRFVATPPDRPVVLSCDIHPWMVAWIYAFDHPHFAVTDAAGRFRIENVPPGRHRLAIRHPGGGLKRDLALEVVADQTTREDVRFTSSDLSVPVR